MKIHNREQETDNTVWQKKENQPATTAEILGEVFLNNYAMDFQILINLTKMYLMNN